MNSNNKSTPQSNVELQLARLCGYDVDSVPSPKSRVELLLEELHDSIVNKSSEMYLDITDDGVVSLKPEYRGAMSVSSYPGAISDQGLNKVGSKHSELPETIVIPDVINEIAVTALIAAMFGYNERVKSITIPNTITALPNFFAREAINLEEIKGTENVKVLGRGALYRTALRKASFPNLEELDSSGTQFTQCAHLISADLGKVKSIPKQAFAYCERLSCVYNANDVVSVADNAFLLTRRLKNLNFLPKLTSIGVNGFRNSRIDFDWSTLNCTFGSNATVLQYNSTDWWSACDYEPCNTPMKSVFDQNDSRWVNDTIGDTDTTYAEGCVLTCASMIYSALEGVEIASPQEFEQVVREINPSLMGLDTKQMTNIKSYLEAVGYTVEYKIEYNADNLQIMYDALKNGALVLASIDDTNDSNSMWHGVVVHGINESGEVLIQDPASYATLCFNKTELLHYAIPIQNITSKTLNDGFLIVTKNTQ